MSGIDEIMKKTKLSLDEMYDPKLDGKLDSQIDGQPDIQQPNQTTIQTSKKQISHLDKNPASNKGVRPSTILRKPDQQSFQPAIQEPGKVETQESGFPEAPREEQRMESSFRQEQPQKAPTYKMTFNLTDEAYKGFNDLYAKRMLQGRKTEKSDLICEAIDWLIKMETNSK